MDLLVTILLYLLCGALSGLASGLLGVGGGIIVVPFLVWTLPYAGIPPQQVMHVAVATSLALIVFTTVASVVGHQRKHAILWPLFFRLLPGMVLGAAVAGGIARFLPDTLLRAGFGVFACVMAYLFAFRTEKEPTQTAPWPGTVKLTALAAMNASICNLLGMGGGSLMVPLFRRYRMSMHNAVATSAACGFPISLVGVVALLLVGSPHTDFPAWTTGYIYWPAFGAMLLPSLIVAPLGANLAHKLPALRLQRIFAGFLLVVGIDMVVGVIETLWRS